MKSYRSFIIELDLFLKKIQWGNSLSNNDRHLISEYINGKASRVLYKLVDSKSLALSGAYFTPPHLTDLALNNIKLKNNLTHIKIFDPTCGAGDLLLGCCDQLPVYPSLKKTISTWGDYIRGLDLHQEFIDVAKRRLILKAISKKAKLSKGEKININKEFQGLKQGDIRNWHEKIPSSTIVMNPPFNLIKLKEQCSWSSGNVSFAAYVFLLIIQNCAYNSEVIAILPDVLRSGSRYKKWRKEVESRLLIKSIKTYGVFSSKVNIDVFIIRGIIGLKTTKKINWFNVGHKNRPLLGDLCEIMVGQVVPHRLKSKGKWKPYITAKDIQSSKVINTFNRKIRFNGSGFKPPFIAIKRTSSPADPFRLNASLVVGMDSIAVENHIIIIKPLDEKISSCKNILKSIIDEKSNNWLNKRIRCRHLTTLAIKQLPLW